MRKKKTWLSLVMIGSIAVFPIVNEIVRSDDSINKTLMTSSSDNVKFDLSTLTGNSLNETFTSQPSNNTLLRAFFNQYKDQIGGTYYNQVFITNDTVNKEFSITAYDWAPNVSGTKTNISYIVNITPIEDLTTIFGGASYTLYSDPTESPWKKTPAKMDFINAIKSKAESFAAIDFNQITVNPENMEYDTSNELYYITIAAAPNSNKYAGSVNIYFALYQVTINFLGLNFKFDADISDQYYPTVEGNVITLNYDGEYNVTDDGTNVSDRSINVPDNYTNTVINLVGNTININPTSDASSITLGENTNVNIRINAPSLNFKGAAGYAGIRVPYSSTLTLDGSSNITCTGGATTTRCGAGIGGVVTTDSGPGGDDSILNCGTVNILGTVSVTATGNVSTAYDKGGASTGIGGAGCSYGYGGKCKKVYIDTTGTITAKGGGYGISTYTYGGSAPGIGGGNVGSYDNNPKYGGDLESIEIHNGTVYVQNGDSNKSSIGSGSVIGGGSVATGTATAMQNTMIAGSLRNFLMTGGTLICKETTTAFYSYCGIGAIIGGGGVVKTQSGKPTDASNFTSGGLDHINISGGSIYLIKNLNLDATKNVKATLQTVGRGSINFLVDNAVPSDATCHGGSIGTFKVSNASILMNKYVVDKQPVDEAGHTLYPCYVPNAINGNVTSGHTLTIPSIQYTSNLVNFTTYDPNAQYSGVIYLPIGSYNDIMINGTTYHAEVTDITTPTATHNIVLA